MGAVGSSPTEGLDNCEVSAVAKLLDHRKGDGLATLAKLQERTALRPANEDIAQERIGNRGAVLSGGVSHVISPKNNDDFIVDFQYIKVIKQNVNSYFEIF